jgi:aryl-alcohol dehydrogenase-like predicted oxidoreductase
MEQRHVGRSGLLTSRLGLGTMGWGREVDTDDAKAMLAAFADAGGTLVDTAAGYADGVSERVVGALLSAGVVARDEVVIVTKAGLGRRTAERHVDISRRALLAILEGSLDRLRTDHVDLWLVHAWSPDVPLDETLSALDFAVGSGRARYAGVGDFAGWQVAKAATWQAAVPGRTPMVAAAVEYSLVNRLADRELRPACADSGLGLLALAPLGRGVLTGKYRHGLPADSRGASPHYESYVARYLDNRSRRVVDAVATAADGLGVTPAHVALAWARDRPGVAAAIVGTRNTVQLTAALASERVTIPAEIRRALDDVSEPPE